MRAPRLKNLRRDAWRKGAEFREIARASARANLATFAKAPRCGAARKRDGKPCVNPAMANGRCAIHGGKTPRGDNWHRPRFPDPSTPKGQAKFNRKLRDLNRYAEKRAARIAAMSPEEFARHQAWHRTHKPGSRLARCAEGTRARNDAEVRLLLSGDAPCRPDSPEKTLLLAERAAVLAELARLDAQNTKPENENEGIFG